MSTIPSTSTGTNPTSSLAHAAECLAKAATTLSEAARAMSAAAKALSLARSASSIHSNPTIVSAAGVGSISLDELGLESSLTRRHLAFRTTTRFQRDDEVPSIDQAQLQSSNLNNTLSNISAGKNTLEETTRPYRILVDNEVNVLLFACSLIEKHKKVICYMNCSIPALALYQKLINDVTEAPVYIITKITAAELERVGNDFLEDQGGTLLLPETVCPNIKLGETDSWVIHIGWPADKNQYEVQKKAHQAKTNMLVVHSECENLYPAGSGIISQSQPWPGNDESFRITVDVLRPLFDERLAAIPSKLKETAYTDWITCHGSNGHRHIRSWTPCNLVYHANLYLLDVLRYRGPYSQGMDPTMEVPLPKVSATFVTDNGLESAVEEGVLRVEPSSSLNHISSLSGHDFAPPGSTPLNEGVPTGVSSDQASITASDYDPHDNPASSSYRPSGSLRGSTPAPSLPEWGKTTGPTPAVGFQPILGHTCIAVEEEFDAIPLICFLAGRYEKLVCFLDDRGALNNYQNLLLKIIGHAVIAPKVTDDEQGNEDAALQFVRHPAAVVLILAHTTKKLPSVLGQHPIGCCVYWGFHLPLRQAKKHRPQLACSSTCVIMTTAQRDKLDFHSTDVREHPSSSELLDQSNSSPLSDLREATRSTLGANPKITKGLYGARLYFFGRVPRRVLSAEEAARRANHYAAHVLLRGNKEDGSIKFPPLGPRLPASPGTVKKFELQPAVEAGLLILG